MKLPPNLTIEQVMEAAQEQLFGTENIGFCLNCGAESDSCEPDARKYKCSECGEREVYGATEIALHLA